MSSLESNIDKCEGYVYYDLQIKNLANNKVPDNLIQLNFFEQRTSPIIEVANMYDMSIIRFEVSSYSLPIYVAKIQENSPNLNKMIHQIAFTYRTDSVYRFGGADNLTWFPVDETITPPVPPSQSANGYQVDSQYYWCYDYNHVLKIVNNGLADAMQRLKNDAINNPALYPEEGFQDIPTPFLTWNETTNTATLYARSDYFNTANTPTTKQSLIEIYFSPTLYAMFNSFPIKKKYIKDNNGVEFKPPDVPPFYQIMVDNFSGSKSVQGLFGQETERYIATPQQYETISEWSPISSLVFTTATIPIVSNQLSNVKLYQNNNLIQLRRPNNNFANIITDLSTDEQSYRGNVLYIPSAEYRWISLTTNQPINQIDIQVFWKSRLGTLVPFTLPSGGACSMKILFRKKQY